MKTIIVNYTLPIRKTKVKTLTMRQLSTFLMILICSSGILIAQKATIRVENVTMKTYQFSDPDPIPNISRIYPYFRFDGYTNNSIQKKWKMVILENDYIKVFVCPDIGGKVWGAIEKSTGREFLYYNHVVKFRDIAMRGPWTSGGLEYNFGDIGHIPSCSTPVDYTIKENADGSVSCTVGAIDLPSRTKWNVEILLQKDKAYFETKASWFNLSPVPTTYYHWMNAAAKASGNLHFVYPGDHYIGHGGEYGTWPNENSRDLSFYENNNFGFYKSYHVINSYTNFFGGYWLDDDFGFGHLASYDDKPGKKLWIWGLSRQGMIWEDLLTDNDGQYIEFQAGKLYNQAAYSSTLTPFKHKEFQAYDADIMNETWFPLVKTGGMVAASEFAVFNVEEKGTHIQVKISALQKLDDDLLIRSGEKILLSKRINLSPLQLDSLQFEIENEQDYSIELGNSKLTYSSSLKERIVDRPIEPNKEFNWNSAYGLYIKGLELEKQRMYSEAMTYYDKCTKKEKSFAPAINRKALLLYRKMDFISAKSLILKSLAIDTYDPEANYIYGLSSKKLGKAAEAKSGFSIAAASVKYRAASYTQLAGIFLQENNCLEALKYAHKALSFNEFNIPAYKILAIGYRKTNQKEKAVKALKDISELDPTVHFTSFENYLWDAMSKEDFQASFYIELPVESYLELAIFYHKVGCDNEAMEVLSLAPENPIVSLWMAELDKTNRDTYLNRVLNTPVNMIFPYREETARILEDMVKEYESWKFKYYLALIYWHKGLINKAKNLFMECGSVPASVPFYLAKAKLFKDERAIVFESITKARDLDKNDWRTALAIIEYYLANNREVDALPLAKEFSSRYPEKPVLGLSYAKALMKTGRYIKSIEFLEKYQILPYEGGTDGRNLYHEACIMETKNMLNKRKYNAAIEYAKKASEWPENLGAGKPYRVDGRMENYIIAVALEKSGKKSEARYYYEQVMNYKRPLHSNESSKLIFQLLAMKQLSREEEANTLLEDNINEFPENPYLKWVASVFRQDGQAGTIRNDILDRQTEVRPYDIVFVDRGFEMITEIFFSISKL